MTQKLPLPFCVSLLMLAAIATNPDAVSAHGGIGGYHAGHVGYVGHVGGVGGVGAVRVGDVGGVRVGDVGGVRVGGVGAVGLYGAASYANYHPAVGFYQPYARGMANAIGGIQPYAPPNTMPNPDSNPFGRANNDNAVNPDSRQSALEQLNQAIDKDQ